MRNERVHRRPARQRLARIHKLKPRGARQRGSRSGHDGIPDPQRVHGRTRIERHEAQLSQQDLSRDTPLGSRDTERARHQLLQTFL